MSEQNFVDFTEVYSALVSIGKNADSITAKALNKAGIVAQETLAKESPYFKGKKYAGRKKGQSYKKEHLRDNTAMTKASKSKHEVTVGYNDEVAWRVHFTEFGTMTQRPQHFIEKTMKQVESEVEKIIMQAMKEAFTK